MPKNKGKGGKNRRRGKNDNDDDKRELIFKEDGQGKFFSHLPLAMTKEQSHGPKRASVELVSLCGLDSS